MSTADEDRIAVRRSLAIELRVNGKPIREIAKQLGVSVGTAHSDVTAVMAEVADVTAEQAETERKLQLERIDKATELCMRLIAEADEKDGLAAIDRLVKLEDRRAKLLGTDAPERSEVKAVTAASPAEAARLIRAAFGDHAIKDTDDTGQPEPG